MKNLGGLKERFFPALRMTKKSFDCWLIRIVLRQDQDPAPGIR